MNPRKVCGECGHHVSMHKYSPDDPIGAGPGECRWCSCAKYRQAEKFERTKTCPPRGGVK